MAGIKFTKLVEDFIATLERYSATVIPIRISTDRPAKIRVITGEKTTDCDLFLWTITHGGGGEGVRPKNERRIQITTTTNFPLKPGVRTLLAGWSEETGAYAFWDARRHLHFSKSSPSVQVDVNTLETACSVGIAAKNRPIKDGHEVVVAVAPPSLLWYVENGALLHNAQSDAPEVVELVTATPEEELAILENAPNQTSFNRRHDLVQLMKLYRDAKFRPAVLTAYSYKCAVCNCDLKLVDAAHIVPITHAKSTDEVTNGMALCRLHHGAYDNGLMGVQSNHRIVINPEMVNHLRDIHLATGFDRFKNQLPERIRIPSSIEVRPKPDFLRLGLELRRFPQRLIA